MSDQDRPLIRRILRGELDAFTILVKRYESSIVNYVYWIVLNRQDALEISQEVFLKVYLSLDKYKSEFKFSTWLFAIAKNAAIDFLRKSHPVTIGIDEEPESGERLEHLQVPDIKELSPEEKVLKSELSKQIDAAMQCLPLPYRQVLVLRHLNDLAYEEVAEILNLPLGTIKNRLFRARELLRERLQNWIE
jgi:RNA polymerase sigma-70 factor (ECF subfamily)